MSIQMMKRRFAGPLGKGILILLIATFVITLPAMFSPGGGFFGGDRQEEQKPDQSDVIATVNGQPLTRADFEQAYQQKVGFERMMAQQYGQSTGGIERTWTTRLEALTDAENNALIRQEAKAKGITVSDRELGDKIKQQVEQEVSGLKMQAKAAKVTDLDRLYAQVAAGNGGPRDERMSERKFRNWLSDRMWQQERPNLEFGLLSEKLKNAVAPLRPVTENELRASYDEIVARIIRVDLRPPGKPARTDAEAKGRADAILAKLRGGADFATVAKTDSDDPEAKRNGGLLDSPMQFRSMDEAWRKGVGPLKPGQYTTEPIKTSVGYAIVRVEKRERKLPPDFEKNKQQDMTSYASQKQYTEWSAYTRGLMEKAKIVVKDPEFLGYLALRQGKVKEGVEFLEAAAEAPDKMGPDGAASVFYQLATYTAVSNNWEKAAELYSRADDYLTSRERGQELPAEAHVQTLLGMGRSYENLWRQYTKEGKADKAKEALDESLTWYQAASDAAEGPSYHEALLRTFTEMGQKELVDKEAQWLAEYRQAELERQQALEAQQKAMEKNQPVRPAGPSPLKPPD